MITDAIISAFLACIDALLTLLPSLDVPFSPSNAVWIAQYSVAFNRIVPMQLFIECILASITLQVAIWVFDGVLWLYHQIHGSD